MKQRLTEQGSPIQKQRQGSGVGMTGVPPGPSPKRLELQEGKAVAGILERRPPASPWEWLGNSHRTPDTGYRKGTAMAPYGAAQMETSLPQTLVPALARVPNPLASQKLGTLEIQGKVSGEMRISHQMKFPPAWQNDGTKWKLFNLGEKQQQKTKPTQLHLRPGTHPLQVGLTCVECDPWPALFLGHERG